MMGGWDSYRADAMDFGEVSFRIAQAARRDVHNMVPIALETRNVASLVATFRGRVHGQGAILLHIASPVVEIETQQVASNEIAQSRTRHATHRALWLRSR